MSSESWDRLWPLLATAGLSLLVFAVSSWFITPRLESRKRLEDRWERDVLALGQFLAFDFTKASDNVFTKTWFRLTLMDPEMVEIEPDRRDQLVTEDEGALREAIRDARAAGTQLRWLIDRVVFLDPGRSDLSKLHRDGLFPRPRHVGI